MLILLLIFSAIGCFYSNPKDNVELKENSKTEITAKQSESLESTINKKNTEAVDSQSKVDIEFAKAKIKFPSEEKQVLFDKTGGDMFNDILTDLGKLPPYSDGLYFFPSFNNSNGVVVGLSYKQTTAEQRDNVLGNIEEEMKLHKAQEVVFYQTTTDSYRTIYSLAENENAMIYDISNDFVLFATQKTESEKNMFEYQLYDFSNNQLKVIYNADIAPEDSLDVIYQKGLLSTEQAFFVTPTIDDAKIIAYDLSNEKFKDIARGNIYSLALVDNKLCYIWIDREILVTELRSIDLVSNESETLLRLDYDKSGVHIFEIKENSGKLFIFMNESSEYGRVYTLDLATNELTYLFTTTYMSNITVSDRFIIWLSGPSFENRARIQSFVYDYQAKKPYRLNAGLTMINDEDIFSITYLKPEDSIPQFESNKAENSEIRHYKLSE